MPCDDAECGRLIVDRCGLKVPTGELAAQRRVVWVAPPHQRDGRESAEAEVARR